jgi:uncharacterized protein
MVMRQYRLGRCYRCGYVWRPRNRTPSMCARCKSRLFDEPKLRVPSRGSGLGIGEVIGGKRGKLVALAKRYGATLSVFGSVARHAAGPGSDVDFLVEYSRPVDLLTNVRLRRQLQSILRRRIELVTEQALHWLVRAQVLAEAVPL